MPWSTSHSTIFDYVLMSSALWLTRVAQADDAEEYQNDFLLRRLLLHLDVSLCVGRRISNAMNWARIRLSFRFSREAFLG